MNGSLEVAKWILTNGVPALLLVVTGALGLVIWNLWRQNAALQDARIDEMKEFIKVTDDMHDKIHTTTHDLSRLVDYLKESRKS